MSGLTSAIGNVFKPITDTVKNVFNTVTKPVEDILKGITGSGFDGIFKGMLNTLTNPLSMFGLGNLASSLLPNIFGGQQPGSLGDIQNMLKDILARLQERQVPGAADGTTVTPPNNLADRFPTDFATLRQVIEDTVAARTGSSGSSSSSSAATGSASVGSGVGRDLGGDIESGRMAWPTKPQMPGPGASDQEMAVFKEKNDKYNLWYQQVIALLDGDKQLKQTMISKFA